MKWIKPSIQEMHEYTLAKRDCEVKLDQNESPFDLPRWFKEEITRELLELHWNRYPEFGNEKLTNKLSEHLGVAATQLLVGNGSNELLQLLISASLEKDDQILLVTPTFLIYSQLAQVIGAKIIEVEFNEDWSFPVDEIIAQLSENDIKLCILCTPNSPTGAVLDPAELQKIATACPGLLMVDEAYFEFANSKTLELQPSFPNIVVTRTFSKAMGLAGMRLGYLVAAPSLVTELRKAKLPYNLNIATELTACKLLDHYELIKENIDYLNREKKSLRAALGEISGIKVFHSNANFLMIETPLPSREVLAGLVEKGVLVRDISGYHPRLKNKLRVSVGTTQDNMKLLEAFKAAFPDGLKN